MKPSILFRNLKIKFSLIVLYEYECNLLYNIVLMLRECGKLYLYNNKINKVKLKNIY